VLPFWVTATTPLMLGLTAFVMMIFIQGAWGVVPAYLNELSPASIRGTFPGFVYQMGNLLAAANANIQIWAANSLHHDFGLAMGLTVGTMALVVVALAAWAPEPKGVDRSLG
jgi:SHS family lactate transporter-like MFS transporter